MPVSHIFAKHQSLSHPKHRSLGEIAPAQLFAYCMASFHDVINKGLLFYFCFLVFSEFVLETFECGILKDILKDPILSQGICCKKRKKSN